MSTAETDDRYLLVHAYCDGELDPVNAKAVELQISADPALAAERDRIMALRRASSTSIHPISTRSSHGSARVPRKRRRSSI